MTIEKKIEIANWLQENQIAYTNGNGDIYVLSEVQFDELDCVLEDWGLQYDVRIVDQWGEWEAFIALK